MEEFREKQTSFFAMQRLKYITDKLDRLRPEIEILNPQERATRMQPLEQQIDSQSISVKSLNVDYKLDRMKELEGEEDCDTDSDLWDPKTKDNTDMNDKYGGKWNFKPWDDEKVVDLGRKQRTNRRKEGR